MQIEVAAKVLSFSLLIYFIAFIFFLASSVFFAKNAVSVLTFVDGKSKKIWRVKKVPRVTIAREPTRRKRSV